MLFKIVVAVSLVLFVAHSALGAPRRHDRSDMSFPVGMRSRNPRKIPQRRDLDGALYGIPERHGVQFAPQRAPNPYDSIHQGNRNSRRAVSGKSRSKVMSRSPYPSAYGSAPSSRSFRSKHNAAPAFYRPKLSPYKQDQQY